MQRGHRPTTLAATADNPILGGMLYLSISSMIVILVILFSLIYTSDASYNLRPSPVAFAPTLGIGSILFKPNVKITKSDGDEELLVDAGKFFVDAFW